MKVKIKKVVELEVVAVRCEMSVRYDEEDIPNDFPLRTGDKWIGVIDVKSGIIRDWPKGKSGRMEMKVCDEGLYSLFGENGEVLAEKDGYVPSCVPGEYGDYVRFDIDEEGKIKDWEIYCTDENIAESFEVCEE